LRVVLSSSAELVSFRQQLRGLLVARRVTKAEREAIVLAAEEAANNALLACEAAECQVEVIVSLIADYVCVEVRDAGAGIKGVCLDLTKLADESAEHGRGLYLMGELMESLELVPRSQGTLVRMTKRLRRLEAADPPDVGRLAS
jgi:anti-sigma regulatory factor (Ser/Thr protein kinase)